MGRILTYTTLFFLISIAVYMNATAWDDYAPAQADTETSQSVTETIRPTFPSYPKNPDEDKLFGLIQEWRINNGYEPYTQNEALCKIAEDRSDDEPLDNHKGLFEKYDNYPFKMTENLVYNKYQPYSNEKGLLDSWLRSDSHREALEDDFAYSCLRCHDGHCSQIFSNMK